MATRKWMFVVAMMAGMILTGCSTVETEETEEEEVEELAVVEGEDEDPPADPEEFAVEEEEPQEREVEEEIEEEEPTAVVEEEVEAPTPDPISAFGNEPPTTAAPPDPSAVASVPAPTSNAWEPKNDNPPPSPVKQGDLRMQCKRIGPGVESGYIRFGCHAMKQDGQHYGVVKGWWHVHRRDGLRAKTKDLNFRESGYDMAFDVYGPDAQDGIIVKPGFGELKPHR